MKLLSIIKNVIKGNSASRIVPILNRRRYTGDKNSVCGGALADSNVLVVYQDCETYDIFRKALSNEKCYIYDIKVSQLLKDDDLREIELSMVGNCDHIINIINERDVDDLPKLVYQWFQKEAPFLSKDNRYASINTVAFFEDYNILEREKGAIKSLIKGLALLLGVNHGMMVNCVLANCTTTVTAVVDASLFMSSKYGEALTGETIVLE